MATDSSRSEDTTQDENKRTRSPQTKPVRSRRVKELLSQQKEKSDSVKKQRQQKRFEKKRDEDDRIEQEKYIEQNIFLPVSQWSLNYQITHDQFFKLAFAIPEVAVAFLQKTLPEKILSKLDLNGLVVQNGVLGESDFFHNSAADLIYVVPYNPTKGSNDNKESESTESVPVPEAETMRISIILEHKSYSDPMTIFQLLCYCSHVMQKEMQTAKDNKVKMSTFRFSPVLPIIIHHGRYNFRGATKLSQLFKPFPGGESYLPELNAILFDLNQKELDDLLPGSNHFLLKSVLTMMQSIFKRDVAIRASEALRILRPYSKDPKYQNLIRTMAIYMLRCGVHLSDNEGLGILRNDKFIDQGDNKMSTVAERWMTKAHKEGVEEGKLSSIKEAVITLLRIRFGVVPKIIQQEINDKCDLIAVKTLFEVAATAQSLQEFAEEL